MGSPRFSLDLTDLGGVILYALMVGVAAALTFLTENSGLYDFGVWQGFAVMLLAAVLDVCRRWLSDNRPTPTLPARIPDAARRIT